jgi:hypothetical protein
MKCLFNCLFFFLLLFLCGIIATLCLVLSGL